MDVDDAIRTRRTHKAYRPQRVDRETLEALFELARWAPNHHVTNPWRFRVVGPRTLEALKAMAEERQPGSARKLERAPTLVAVTARQDEDPEQAHEDLLATAIAAYIVLLGAHARGLAGYWRTVSFLDDDEGRRALDLAADEVVLGLLYLGVPVQEQPPPEREPVGAVASFLD